MYCIRVCVPVESEELVEADLGVGEAEDDIQHVGGNHGDQVQFELEAFHVTFTQLQLILHQQTLLQVACTYRHTHMQEQIQMWKFEQVCCEIFK